MHRIFFTPFNLLCSTVLLFLFLNMPMSGAIPKKCEEICQAQLDSIPLENFKREKILSHVERAKGILVEVKNNNLFDLAPDLGPSKSGDYAINLSSLSSFQQFKNS